MKSGLDFKSILLVNICYLLQTGLTSHHNEDSSNYDEESQSHEIEFNEEGFQLQPMPQSVPIPMQGVVPISFQMAMPQMLMPQISLTPIALPTNSFSVPLINQAPNQEIVYIQVQSAFLKLLKSIVSQSKVATTQTVGETSTLQNPTTTSTITTTTPTPATSMTTLTTRISFRDYFIRTLPPKRPTILRNDVSQLEDKIMEEYKTENCTEDIVDNIPEVQHSTAQQDENYLDSVLENIITEFTENLLKTPDKSNRINGRQQNRRMGSSIKRRKPKLIPSLRILPIPDNVAAILMSHIRSIQRKSEQTPGIEARVMNFIS